MKAVYIGFQDVSENVGEAMAYIRSSPDVLSVEQFAGAKGKNVPLFFCTLEEQSSPATVEAHLLKKFPTDSFIVEESVPL